MIKVDVLFPAYINATIGPCGTLRRLLKNKDYIQKRGFELTIYTLDSVRTGQVNGEYAVDFSKGLSFRSRIKSWISRTNFGVYILQQHNRKLSSELVKFYLKQNRSADVVVFHESLTCGVYAPHKKANQKIVCFFHSDGTRWGMVLKAHPSLEKSIWLKIMDKNTDSTLRQIDHYVFIAKMGRDNFLRENRFVKTEDTSFFHNGIEMMPVLHPKKDSIFKYSLCTVGSLSHRKGQYLIVEALHRIPLDILQDIHLTIYGSGPDYDFISKMVYDYGLREYVTLYGNLPNSMIHHELSKHNIFLLMSNNEGLPISIIEAMRAGLPVISTHVSGIPEEVDDRNGILINPNADELSAVLSKIDLYNWEEMGRQSRLRFENEFSFQKMLESYCDMLDTTIGQ